MKTVILASALLAMATTGCVVNKVLEPTGGSKADGTVRMSYTVGAFEQAKVDFGMAQSKAVSRCQAWGYEGAERFGGSTSVCNMFDGYGGCNQSTITIEYQCIGKIKE
jgi:hypothetical protein